METLQKQTTQALLLHTTDQLQPIRRITLYHCISKFMTPNTWLRNAGKYYRNKYRLSTWYHSPIGFRRKIQKRKKNSNPGYSISASLLMSLIKEPLWINAFASCSDWAVIWVSFCQSLTTFQPGKQKTRDLKGRLNSYPLILLLQQAL